jgi:hypothetical protein
MYQAPIKLCLPVLIMALSVTSLFAQKNRQADSLWCDHLNEILKCASLDIITGRVGTNIDTSYIAPFIPRIGLSPGKETMAKEYNKVTYTCYFYSSPTLSDALMKQFDNWHKKVRKCLSLWDETRLKNGDPALAHYQDYFITNSEDETTVRLDIFHDNNSYHVRMRIF